jgi:hypothetical protein
MNSIAFMRLLAFLLFCSSIGADALADEISNSNPQRKGYVIGVSPFLDKTVKDEVYRRIVGFVLEDVPLNSSISIFDAYNLRTITRLEVPSISAFRSAKTRANQFKEPIHKLKDFLAADPARPATNAIHFDRAIRFPQFMDFVGENLADSRRSTSVIILGSPLYLDHKEPAFAMVDGYFPSDGHLIAAREKSVFGTKNRAEALKNVIVHFCYFGDPWVSDVHQEKIARFWSLYLKRQGAGLATFCGDLATTFGAVRDNTEVSATRDARYELDPGQTKIEMLRITRDIGLADWITRETLPNPRQSPPSISVGPMKIGIRWKGNLDIDLYATARPNAETLFFEHTRSPEGYYFKDHRSSPDREYEFIEFESPVDVWQVEAMINFYKGQAVGGPSGEVRIEFDGKVYGSRFSLAAFHGNEGRSGSSQGEYWTRIDVPAVLKLREGNRNAEASRR